MSDQQFSVQAFCFYYPVSYSPTVINTLNSWGQHFCIVNLLVDREVFGEISGLSPNVRVKYVTDKTISKAELNSSHAMTFTEDRANESHKGSKTRSFIPKWVRLGIRKVAVRVAAFRSNITRNLAKFINSNDWFLNAELFFSLRIACFNLISKEKSKFAVGFDDCGAVLAYCYSILSGTPFYIHSLELDNLPAFKFRLTRFAVRKLLKRAIKRAKFVVIQDEKRAAAYVDYTGAKPKEFVYFPVGHRSSPSEVPQPPIQPRNKFGAIMVGAMSPATQARELATQVTKDNWPKDWYLHFHGFCTSPELLQYFATLANEYPSRFGFSLEHYSDSEIYSMLTHFHAGICLYGERGPNYELTIFSSGKIAQYLQCGLPIVVNDFPFTQQVVDDLQMGITIPSCDELATGLTQLASLDGKREKSLAAFEKHYNFDRNFAKILDQFSIQSNNETSCKTAS